METIAETFFSLPLMNKLIVVGIIIVVFFIATKLFKSVLKAIFLLAVGLGLLMTYYFIKG